MIRMKEIYVRMLKNVYSVNRNKNYTKISHAFFNNNNNYYYCSIVYHN